MPQHEADFSKSHFLDGIDQLLHSIAAAEADLDPPRGTTASTSNAALALGHCKARGPIKGWWLELRATRANSAAAMPVVGSVLCNARGSTSPIEGYDPVNRRIQTRSGTVYALGMPDVGFAARNRQVLRTLGF